MTTPTVQVDATNDATDATKRLTAARRELAELDRQEAEEAARLDALAREGQAHRDAARAAIDNIVALKELAAAYKISGEEGRIVQQEQALLADGYDGTAESLRELAKAMVDARKEYEDSRFDRDDSTGGVMEGAGERLVSTVNQGLRSAVDGIFGDSVLGRTLSQTLMPIFDGLINQLSSGLGGLFGGGAQGGLLGFFAGFFADGGTIAPGKFGIVGENGPEIAYGGNRPVSITPFETGISRDARSYSGKDGRRSSITVAPVYNFSGYTNAELEQTVRRSEQRTLRLVDERRGNRQRGMSA
jgi:hypothetical protein